MITDRNKLNFVTIQWLWFLCLTLAAFSSNYTWIHNVEATQQQQQEQHQQQPQQQQLKSTLQLQPDTESNGPLQSQKQQEVTVRNFSPRVDYNNNEWRPVGRGDPLKNDPTFDYSPPTLDRVRYWADSDKDKEKTEEVPAATLDAKLKKANPGKNEILLLGDTSDRMRDGAQMEQHASSMLKNAKGETPLLQPKYTMIRRSYYAHNLPTHLMPPPMQPMVTAPQSHQVKQHQMQQSPMPQSQIVQPLMQQHQLQHQQSQSQQHQVQSMHTVKPVHTEYRHNMLGHSYMTSSPMSSMSVHSKPYYMPTSPQPWMHTSNSLPMGTTSSSSSGHSAMMPVNLHHFSHPHIHSHNSYSHSHDSHHQESMNYLSYHSHPSLTSTPSIMMSVNGAISQHDMYSPNSIRSSSSVHKSSSTSSRKPWIHDLLQKEFVKPIKPTQSPNSYHVETVKSTPMESHFEPIMHPQSVSTTYTPIPFAKPTMPSSTTTHTVYETSTSQKSTSTSHYPMYTTTVPTHTTYAPRSTTTLSPTRLLIPNTSNLVYRPTVAPIKMTTDSLFSHYHQPEKPLTGPMYLIIEGHSKVKTYGKDELDPHKPKIVPVIPNREPVVKIGDPTEKRGTPETFQVKHLHTKTTKLTEKLTAPTSSTTLKSTSTITTTTTNKPQVYTTIAEKSKTTSTTKPTPKRAVMASSPTTPKSATSKVISTLSVTTKAATTITTTTTKPKVEKIIKNDDKSLTEMDKSTTNSSKMVPKIPNPNALETPKKPSHMLMTEPPTGMQGLLTLLDSSLNGIFKEHVDNAPNTSTTVKDVTTKLKPMPMKQTSPEIEARVSTKLKPINAEDYEDYTDDNYLKVTTEYLPRETRQIFDYDQLPESRIDLKDGDNFEDFLDQIDDEEDFSAFNLDDEYEENSREENVGQTVLNNNNNKKKLTKRDDTLIHGRTEDDFADFSSLVNDNFADISDEDNLTNLTRKQPQHIKKA